MKYYLIISILDFSQFLYIRTFYLLIEWKMLAYKLILHGNLNYDKKFKRKNL